MWNPWQTLTDRAEIVLEFCHDLGPGVWGTTTYGRRPTIRLLHGLTQAQRRCTLAHELVHVERGPVAATAYVAREETVVDRVAARRLITHAQLADALVWAADEHQLADQLHVDVDMVLARLADLTDTESLDLVRRLEEAELRNP